MTTTYTDTTTNETRTQGIDPKIQALAQHLGCAVDEISTTRYDSNTFDAPGGEYMVLTDDEATAKARYYILDSVWAFRPEFLASYTPNGVDAEIIKMIQDNGKCEGNNDKLRGLIDDEDRFVDDAISTDGRGHFLNTYDGNEDEIAVGEEIFYVYRVNQNMCKAQKQERVKEFIQKADQERVEKILAYVMPLIQHEFDKVRKRRPNLEKIIFGNGTFFISFSDDTDWTLGDFVPGYAQDLYNLCLEICNLGPDDVLPSRDMAALEGFDRDEV